MSENNTNNQESQEKARTEALEGFTRGTLTLSAPIRAASTDIAELKYDFSKLTGWEYVEAMDSDANSRNVFKITSKQALCLFAATAAKETPLIDATDIKQRIGVADAAKAVQLATVFLVTSTREARKTSSGT